MRNIETWLDEYGVSHRHPTNKMIHWICVPLIMIALIGLLWAVPVSAAWGLRSPFFNWGVGAVLLMLVYDYILAWRLALGMTLISLLMIGIVYGASLLPVPLGWLAAAVFVLAWAGQFIGHGIEGRKPSFIKDLQFLLIGPLWLLAFVYRSAGLPTGRRHAHP
ncbi:MAG: Mpo1 family 2-hydroxy fatty acid dioxygenase [Gammaproteobacteria bacterium]